MSDRFSFNPEKPLSDSQYESQRDAILERIENTVDLEDSEKIISIEKATNSGNYNEEELFNLYKRFKFSIDQLLTVEDSYKLLPSYQGRALLYQGILITEDAEKKLKLISILKNLFIEDNISDAFRVELSYMLKQIDKREVSSDYSNFYSLYLNLEELDPGKIKFDNTIPWFLSCVSRLLLDHANKTFL